MAEYTQRQKDAVLALKQAVETRSGPVTPSGFAMFFWPGKEFARGNGPWGLGPDASGRHGGRMLTKLYRLGLARLIDQGGGIYYTAELTDKGKALATVLEAHDSTTGAPA